VDKWLAPLKGVKARNGCDGGNARQGRGDQLSARACVLMAGASPSAQRGPSQAKPRLASLGFGADPTFQHFVFFQSSVFLTKNCRCGLVKTGDNFGTSTERTRQAPSPTHRPDFWVRARGGSSRTFACNPHIATYATASGRWRASVLVDGKVATRSRRPPPPVL